MQNLPILLLLISLPTIIGCGNPEQSHSTPRDPSASNTPPPDSTGPASDTTPPVPPPEASPSELDQFEERFAGTYGLRNSVTTVQSLPLMGESNTLTLAYAIATISRDGDGFIISEKGCHVDSMPESGISTVIPDAVPRSIPTTPQPFHLWEENGEVQWSRPEKVVLMGVQLENPANDELPSSSDDGRIWDQDEDGNPGITVTVEGFVSGDIYVIQRTFSSYTGVVGDDDNFTGWVDELGQQQVIGATNPMLNQNIPTEPHPDPDQSTVQLVRLAGATTCDELIQQKDSLF